MERCRRHRRPIGACWPLPDSMSPQPPLLRQRLKPEDRHLWNDSLRPHRCPPPSHRSRSLQKCAHWMACPRPSPQTKRHLQDASSHQRCRRLHCQPRQRYQLAAKRFPNRQRMELRTSSSHFEQIHRRPLAQYCRSRAQWMRPVRLRLTPRPANRWTGNCRPPRAGHHRSRRADYNRAVGLQGRCPIRRHCPHPYLR